MLIAKPNRATPTGKVCVKCKGFQPLAQFGLVPSKQNPGTWWMARCKNCRKADRKTEASRKYHRDWNKTAKGELCRIRFRKTDKYKIAVLEHRKRQQTALKLYLTEVKQVGCSQCGFNKWPEALDFHHLDPKEKRRTISSYVTRACSLETLQEEMAKCALLCANCHRHETKLNGYRNKASGN